MVFSLCIEVRDCCAMSFGIESMGINKRAIKKDSGVLILDANK